MKTRPLVAISGKAGGSFMEQREWGVEVPSIRPCQCRPGLLFL